MDLTISLSPFVASSLVGIVCSLGALLVVSLLIAMMSNDRMAGLLPVFVFVAYFWSPRWVINLVLVLVLAGLAGACWPASAVLITAVGSAVIACVIGLSALAR
jgi:hypothetical protein